MMKSNDMDAVFQALANESRRRMLDIVKEEPGIGVGALAADFDVSRIAVMKHLTVLEDANLIVSEKDGRTRKLYFNAAPIQMIHERWTTKYSAYWAGQLTRIKYLAEARAEAAQSSTGIKKQGKTSS
ncbi:ArsR/SmtB family transcription factor [Hyphococcus sp.]|uniref:ArsR/SmtB family transcription factor n=1 Tax=Hyphococcus sp. TaxID=2038636 RepID=UPI003CCC1B72